MSLRKVVTFVALLVLTALSTNAQSNGNANGQGLSGATLSPTPATTPGKPSAPSNQTCSYCTPLLPNDTNVIAAVLELQKKLTVNASSAGNTFSVVTAIMIVAACQNSSTQAYEILATVQALACKNPNLTLSACDAQGVGTQVEFITCGMVAIATNASTNTTPPTGAQNITGGQNTTDGSQGSSAGTQATTAKGQSTPVGGQSSPAEAPSTSAGGQGTTPSGQSTQPGSTTPSGIESGSSTQQFQLEYACWAQYAL